MLSTLNRAQQIRRDEGDAPGVPSSPIEVCLVAHLAFGALTGTSGHGGVEHQTSMLARWLAGRGHRVSMITWDEGQSNGRDVAGVKVITACQRDEGWPGLRFFHPRWSSLVRALHEANADCYYHNGAEYVTGQVALWCHRHGRRFVFSSASDSDCDAALPLLPARRERLLYRVGLRRADRIIVQTRTQQQMLRASFGHESTVIPMPCAGPGDGPPAGVGRAHRHRLVWIGRICEVKRPDRLLDLATQCTDLSFDLIGGEDGSAYARAIVERAKQLQNVTVHGAVSRERIAAILRETMCLCSTSDIEGFPNTFLEAWSHAVPVLSTFDPDGLIEARRIGWLSAPEGFVSQLRRLLANGQLWEETSNNARRYYLETHTIESAMPRFEALFLELSQARHE